MDLLTLYNCLKGGCSKMGVILSPRDHGTVQEDIASSCAKGDSAWILGGNSSLVGLLNFGMGCPEKWWCHHAWRCLKKGWM